MNFDALGVIWNEFVMINENSRGEGELAEMWGKYRLLEKRILYIYIYIYKVPFFFHVFFSSKKSFVSNICKHIFQNMFRYTETYPGSHTNIRNNNS